MNKIQRQICITVYEIIEHINRTPIFHHVQSFWPPLIAWKRIKPCLKAIVIPSINAGVTGIHSFTISKKISDTFVVSHVWDFNLCQMETIFVTVSSKADVYAKTSVSKANVGCRRAPCGYNENCQSLKLALYTVNSVSPRRYICTYNVPCCTTKYYFIVLDIETLWTKESLQSKSKMLVASGILNILTTRWSKTIFHKTLFYYTWGLIKSDDSWYSKHPVKYKWRIWETKKFVNKSPSLNLKIALPRYNCSSKCMRKHV